MGLSRDAVITTALIVAAGLSTLAVGLRLVQRPSGIASISTPIPSSPNTRELQYRIIYFFSYGCSACLQLDSALDKAASQGRSVTVTYRPLEGGGRSDTIAVHEAQCADIYGLFLDAHHLLMRTHDLPVSELAARIGIPNRDEYVNCIGERRFRVRLDRYKADASRYGIQDVPGLVFNEKKIQSSLGALDSVLRQ